MSKRTKSWILWIALLVPSMAIINIAIATKGFMVVFPLLVIVLAASLLGARYVGGRSWHSIMWGDHD